MSESLTTATLDRAPDTQTQTPWGLYIHWPFCVSKCPYCDFNSHVRASVDQARWRAAMVREILQAGAVSQHASLKSIFFGGGTPSLMPPETVAACIEAARDAFDCVPGLEISLEANPSSVETEKFAALAQAGVNRISIGVQSFDAEALKFLGRAHDPQEAQRAIEAAQAHFGRVSFDLIYALPDQSSAHWRNQMEMALGFGTTHLSVYQLTIEPNTGFQGQVARGVFKPMADDFAADLFDITQDVLGAAGLPAYEISNHARSDAQCQHNLVYWRGEPYAAVGPGAHGRWRRNDGWRATRNLAKPERWLAAIEGGGSAAEDMDHIPPNDRALEMLMMGLRLAEGICLAHVSALSDFPATQIISQQAIAQLTGDGLIRQSGDRLAITSAGRPVTNAILDKIIHG